MQTDLHNADVTTFSIKNIYVVARYNTFFSFSLFLLSLLHINLHIILRQTTSSV